LFLTITTFALFKVAHYHDERCNSRLYLGAGTLLVVWPGVTQTLFMDPAFVGHEGALVRVIGLTLVVIGWLYLFGGRSGARQFVAASVIDRLVFIPAVLVPLAIAGAFLPAADIDAMSAYRYPLRAGFVTSADAAGAPIAKVMEQARHVRFETTRGYIREADAFRDNAASYLGL